MKKLEKAEIEKQQTQERATTIEGKPIDPEDVNEKEGVVEDVVFEEDKKNEQDYDYSVSESRNNEREQANEREELIRKNKPPQQN